MVPPCSDRVSRAPPYSRIKTLFTSTGLSPTMVHLSRCFLLLCLNHWPGPSSLVTTIGVSFDVLSSGYLDISVLRVCFLHLCIQCKIPVIRWVSPFGNLRVTVYCQLAVAYRRLTRPSSPSTAKASAKCSFYIYTLELL
jgi:hypothetical protein